MYGRIFEGFWDSSLCQKESYSTRLAFCFMFTFMNEDGYVHCANAKVLARRANITPEEAEEAIKALSSPDPDSSNPANEGRRIDVVPGGFIVLNAEYYQSIKNREMEREKNRARVANWRKTKKCNAKNVTGKASVMICNDPPEYEYESESVLEKGVQGEKQNGDSWHDRFEQFWKAYPNKKGKGNAEIWWEKNKPSRELTDKMLVAIATQKCWTKWADNDGQYIPHPTTWLNGKRWEDEALEKPVPNGQSTEEQRREAIAQCEKEKQIERERQKSVQQLARRNGQGLQHERSGHEEQRPLLQSLIRNNS